MSDLPPLIKTDADWDKIVQKLHAEIERLRSELAAEREIKIETNRLWRAINGMDQDDYDKRAERFVYSMLDGLTVGQSNRSIVISAIAEHFADIAKAERERCARVTDAQIEAVAKIIYVASSYSISEAMGIAKDIVTSVAAAIRALDNVPIQSPNTDALGGPFPEEES